MARRRGAAAPGPADLDLFDRAMADVAPLDPDGAPARPAPRPPEDAGPEEAEADARPSGEAAPAPLRPRGAAGSGARSFPALLEEHGAGRAPGLDRRTALRLRRGQIGIDGRIDLHGMTRRKAHAALAAFVASGRRHGRRCLLVITGKGGRPRGETGFEGERTGVLRREAPRWLAEPPLAGDVLAVAPARPADGGDGAFYVLLRRRRT